MKTKMYTVLCIALIFSPIIGKSQYYKDLKSNIAQAPATLSGVSDIQSAFNNGRTKENQQLGTNLQPLTFPSNWGSLNIQQRAVWIVNQERVDRGLKAFTGTESNVISVAQAYADYLLKNNKFGHTADGLSPATRLNKNATIGACNEAISSYENLYVTVSSSVADIPYEVEYALYSWLYNDANSAWGHRRCLLQTAFKDNSGAMNEEGLFGMGVAAGGPYKGDFSQSWNYAEIVVFNVIDPCASWIYTGIYETSEAHKYSIYYDGNTIKINSPAPENDMNVSVYTMLGENIYTRRYTSVQGDIALESLFAPGVYIVRIVLENQFSYSRKIIVGY